MQRAIKWALLALVAVTLVAAFVVPVQAAPAGPTLTLNYGDHSIKLNKGLVVRNVLNDALAEGGFELVVTGGKSDTRVDVSIGFSGQDLTVENVTVTPVTDDMKKRAALSSFGGATAYASNIYYYEKARSTILCPFGVTSSEVVTEDYYLDNGVDYVGLVDIQHRVYDGSFPPGWDMFQTQDPVYYEYTSGSYFHLYTRGYFDSACPEDQVHNMRATCKAWAGGDHSTSCYLSSLPSYPGPLSFHWQTEHQWYRIS